MLNDLLPSKFIFKGIIRMKKRYEKQWYGLCIVLLPEKDKGLTVLDIMIHILAEFPF